MRPFEYNLAILAIVIIVVASVTCGYYVGFSEGSHENERLWMEALTEYTQEAK